MKTSEEIERSIKSFKKGKSYILLAKAVVLLSTFGTFTLIVWTGFTHFAWKIAVTQVIIYCLLWLSHKAFKSLIKDYKNKLLRTSYKITEPKP